MKAIANYHMRLVLLVLFLTLFGSAPPSAFAADWLRAVAVSNDAFFTSPQINNRGEVAFSAWEPRFPSPRFSSADTLVVPREGAEPASRIFITGSGDLGLYTEAGTGELTRIATIGAPAPGTGSGGTFANQRDDRFFGNIYEPIDNIRITDHGTTIFRAQIEGGSAGDLSIYRHRAGGELELIALEGTPAPGFDDGTVFENLVGNQADFSYLRDYYVQTNKDGDVVFLSMLSSTFNEPSVFADKGDGLQLIATRGTPVPGVGPDVTFASAGLAGITDDDKVIFHGHIFDSEGHAGYGIFTEQASELQMVTNVGDPAPGIDATIAFRHFIIDRQLSNSSGQTAYRGNLEGDSIDENKNGVLLFNDVDGSLHIVAREGAASPVDGLTINYLSDPLSLSPAGETIFGASLEGETANSENDYALFTGGKHGVSVVAREGDEVLGTMPGDSSVLTSIWGGLDVNDQDQTVFLADVADNVGSESRRAIVLAQPGEPLRTIIEEGDQLDISNDPDVEELREVSILLFRDNSTFPGDRCDCFNDRGEVAFVAHFTGGTRGVFVANVNVVPEPTALVLLLSCLFVSNARYRRLSTNQESR